jgi:hypothetical protein
MKPSIKKSKMRKLSLLYRAFMRRLNSRIEDFTRHEPIQKNEAVEKTLYLLSRDFTISEQNEIVLSLIRRLHNKREADIVKLHKQMETMREETQRLREKVELN